MKIFLLTITVILLFYRIKNAPKMLSKKKYMKAIKDGIEKGKKSFYDKTPDKKEQDVIRVLVLFFLFIVECLVALYYILIGSHISVMYFTILTVFEILTVIETSRKQINMKSFSINIEDYKFHRLYFLFNVVLDLVYYPLAIYLLLK